MPHYEVHHTCDLRPSQADAIASALTSLHCHLFSAPSMFVNVVFHTTSRFVYKPSNKSYTIGDTQRTYVGGKRHETNYIIAHIRPRRPENKEKLNILVQEIVKVWNKYARTVIKDPGQEFHRRTTRAKDQRKFETADLNAPGRLDDLRALHNCFVMQDIDAGIEQGFILPTAGQDGQWLEDNMEVFRTRAADGDQSMQGLLEEIKNGVGSGPVEVKPAVKSKL